MGNFSLCISYWKRLVLYFNKNSLSTSSNCESTRMSLSRVSSFWNKTKRTIYNLYLPSASVSGTEQTTATDDSNRKTGRRQTSWLFTSERIFVTIMSIKKIQTEIYNQKTVQNCRREWITSHHLLRCNSTFREMRKLRSSIAK